MSDNNLTKKPKITEGFFLFLQLLLHKLYCAKQEELYCVKAVLVLYTDLKKD